MRDTLYFSKLRVFLAGWRWRLQRFRPSQWRRWLRTHRTTCSPRPASLFTLEPLESRVLLAADLSSVVAATTQLDPAVPTNAATVTVQVLNIGDQPANATTQVAVYASTDATLDSADVLLGTANTAALNVGQSRNVTVNLGIPNSITPGSYNLLARVDATNVIAEGPAGEANNTSVRTTAFTVAWQFGNVPGRSGNTTLTLRDADGTRVTFRLTGPGLGEVIRDGAAWDLKVTGTSTSSNLTISTDTGGNDRVAISDVHVFGPIGSYTAPRLDLSGTLAIDGTVNTLVIGDATGGVIAAQSIASFSARNLISTNLYIGTTLGQDGKLGGLGTDADAYGQGRLRDFLVTGSMVGSTVRVGVNPIDGNFGNGNDTFFRGGATGINSVTIGESLSSDSRFIARNLPEFYQLAGRRFSTNGDVHFTTDPNTAGGPRLTASLQQDTGSSTSDRLTNNPAIVGAVTDPQRIRTFTAGFGATPTFNILGDRRSNGTFTLTGARLEQINGGPLADGLYTLILRATDTRGNATQIALPFRLDRTAPTTLTLDLDAASDTPPLGDHQTTAGLVTLAGQTEPNALVELIGLGRMATANGVGVFSFTNVSLALGVNTFNVRATDLAGNARTLTQTITRVSSVTNQLPTLTAIGNQSIDEGQTLSFTATATEPDAGQTVTFRLESGASGSVPSGATINPTTGAFSWTPTEAQGPGTFTFDVVVTDNGSPNLSDRETIAVTVGEMNQAPALAPIADQNVTVGQLLSFTAAGSDADLPVNVLTYSLEGTVPAGATINATTGAFSWTPTAGQVGPQSVTVRVTDNGTPTLFSEQVVSITVAAAPNVAPVLNAIGNQTISEHLPFTFTATATDPDVGQTLTFSLANGTSGLVPAGATINPATGALSWTPTEAQGPGTFTFDVVVTDNGTPNLSDRETITITVNEANAAPVLLTGSVPVGQVDSPLTPVGPVGNLVRDIVKLAPGSGPGTFNVSDSDAGAVTGMAISSQGSLQLWYSLDNGTTWVPFSSSLSNVRLLAADASTRLFVSPPSIDFAGSRANEFMFQAWDQTVGTNGGVITTGTLTGPTGAFSTKFAQATVIFIEDQVTNQAPVLAVIGDQTVDEGQALTLTATATDPNAGQTLTFSLENGASGAIPAGATINPTTGAFSWTPIEAQGPGSFTFDVVVTDNGSPNLTDRETITVTVGEVNQAPTLNTIADQTVTAGQLLSFTAVGSDADVPANTLTYSLEGTVPAGAAINPTTGEVTWTPTAGQVGPHSLTVRVTDNGTPALFAEQGVSLTVSSSNQAPVAVDDSFTMTAGGSLSGVPFLVKDLATGLGSSTPLNLVDVNGTLFFTADTTGIGRELWKSDGTAAGTLLVKDIVGGSGSSSPQVLTNVNGTLFFFADNGVTGVELWKSDGTVTGTVLVKDINPGSGSTLLSSFTPAVAAVNNTLFFTAFDPINGVELWKSDGTEAGTVLVKDIRPGANPNNSFPDLLTVANGTLFFVANDGVSGPELWKSDGTAAGTVLVQNVNPAGGFHITELEAVNGIVFFTANNGNGLELWKSDGTVGGAIQVANLNGAIGANPRALTNLNGTLYFIATDSTSGTELWKTDGTAAGTVLVSDMNSGSGSSNATFLTAVGGKLFFRNVLPGGDFELWVSDGTALGTTSLGGPIPDTANGTPYITDVNGVAYFRAGGTGNDLWKSDGTLVGTVPVGLGTAPRDLVKVGDALYFSGVSSGVGRELMKVNGEANLLANDSDPEGSALTAILVSGPSNGSLTLNADGTFSYTPNSGFTGTDSFTYKANDGSLDSNVATMTITVTAAPVVNQAPVLNSIGNQTIDEGQLLSFTATASDPDAGQTLTFSLENGTSGLVPAGASINPTTGTFSWTPTEAQGPGTFTFDVVVSDGTLTASETIQVTVGEVNQAPQLTAIGTQTVDEGQLLTFTATASDADVPVNTLTYSLQGAIPAGASINPTTGAFTWTPTAAQIGPHSLTIRVTDNGSPAQFDEETIAVTVNDINVAPTATNDAYTVQQNSTLIAGTLLMKDIFAGATGSFPDFLTNVNGTLFFRGQDSVNGSELWKSDGIAAGTVLVKDINPGSGHSSPLFLTNVNGTLFFTAETGAPGQELWKSDGTTAGTVMVRDFGPSSSNLDLNQLTNVNGTLFFTADDGVNGIELWKSDGTLGGTVMVKDIMPGDLGSNPHFLTNVDGTLFFSAWGGVGTGGFELWKSDGTTAGTVLVKDINTTATNSSSPGFLTNVNGVLFFIASDGISGIELWKSDGTGAGTVLVKDIVAGGGGSTPNNLTNVNGTLFLIATTAANGTELWKSDGTDAGTILVKDIRVGTVTSNPQSLTNVNGMLFFIATDGVKGLELWSSDGTEAGTVLVKDINPGGLGSNPNKLINVNNSLFFYASDGVRGQELWKSDGTGAGTVLVKDVEPGSIGSNSGTSSGSVITSINGILFFSANDSLNGVELWASGLQNNLLANDSDPDSPTLTANLGTGPANGSLVFNADGTFTYRPNAGFAGTDTFTYSVSDGVTTSNLATVTITVT